MPCASLSMLGGPGKTDNGANVTKKVFTEYSSNRKFCIVK
jgi:hypothetical protein